MHKIYGYRDWNLQILSTTPVQIAQSWECMYDRFNVQLDYKTFHINCMHWRQDTTSTFGIWRVGSWTVNINYITYLFWGSKTIARGVVVFPVEMRSLRWKVRGSMTSMSLSAASVQYSFLFTQSHARPSTGDWSQLWCCCCFPMAAYNTLFNIAQPTGTGYRYQQPENNQEGENRWSISLLG